MDNKPTMKFTEINLISGLELKQSECKICRGSLSAPSLKFTPYNGIYNDNILSKGVCGHIFHRACIIEELNNKNISCNQCNLVWKDAEINPHFKSDFNFSMKK